jgi:protein-S-isoprenylcysteine O-methyltransferase Ste14
MSLIFEVFIIVGLFTLFSISHTLLATTKIKNKIIEKVGTKIAFYRLFYNVSSNVKEFLGISQIKRYLKNSYNIEELDEHSTMVIKGPFKYTRHPIYFFSICFLTLRPVMDLFYLILLLCIIIYFYIGSIYEEKKLIEKFNGKYEDYQKRVPRMVPSMVFKRKYFSEKK